MSTAITSACQGQPGRAAAISGAGALYQPLLGWLLDLAWAGEMASGARVYTVTAYSIAFSVLVAGAVVGIACTLMMRETRCRQSA